MTQEDKELLLKDLCVRQPYGVVYNRNDGANIKLNSIDVERGLLNYTDDIEERECKPYLRSMSSMTEEERNEFYYNRTFHDGRMFESEGADVDWLNKHHFDYRNLIEKGLALEAPEGMYEKV